MAGLGSNDVDVVVLNRSPPLLYHRVLRDGERLLAAICERRRHVRAGPSPATATSCRSLQRWRLSGARPRPAVDEPWTDRRFGGAAPPRVAARGARESAPSLRVDTGEVARGCGSSLDGRAWLQLCAQNAIDIATHLATSAGREASDYASAIDRLREMGVLPGVFGARFRQIAGFRNVLVHDYIEVDLDVVARVLNENLDDFEEFARWVERHLDGLPAT